MKFSLKTMLLATLPLAGLLFTAPVASAHSWEHRQNHRALGEMHDEFHHMPHSRREHRQFHRWLKHEHRAMDRELWEREHGGYSYGRPYYGGRSYYPYDRYDYGGRYYDRGYYPYGGYGYGGRGYYGGGYTPYAYDRYGYGAPWAYGGASPYGDPYSSYSLPSLLGPALGILLPR